MLNMKTGIYLNAVEIVLGDRIQGDDTEVGLVLWDEGNDIYGVEVEGNPNRLWLELEIFLNNPYFTGLKVIGNVNKRSK